MNKLINMYGLLRGKVVLFNAPLLCGKDFAVEHMMKATGCGHSEFKMTLHNIAMAITGLSKEAYFEIYNDRSKKEEAQPEFFGMSPRGMLIWISESVCKPQFGERFFGMSAAQTVDPQRGAAFSDSGFPEEVFPLADRFGAENIYVVRFTRNGADFSKDSRDFLQPEDCPAGVHFIDLVNDGDICEFINVITDYIHHSQNTIFNGFPTLYNRR